MSSLRLHSCVLLVAVACAGPGHERDNWSRFRGPNGSGQARGSYPTRVGPDENVLWKRPFPEGMSSPILSAECLFLTGVEQQRLFTYALDRESGETLWRREAPRPRRTRLHPKNHPAAASAAVDDDTVIVFFDEYGLMAYDHLGTERWRLPLGPFDNMYGMGASPILVDDVAVLACDQTSGSFVIGVDKYSGRELWRQARPRAVSGHCTPVLHEGRGGRKEVILPGSFLLDAYDHRTGERLWWMTGLPAEMKSVPVVRGDTLWVHGYAAPLNDKGKQIELPRFSEALGQLDADQSGAIRAEELPDERIANWFGFYDLDQDGSLGGEEWRALRESLSAVNSAMAVDLRGPEGERGQEQVLWRYYRSIPQLPSPLITGDTYYMLADQGGLLSLLDAASGKLIEKGRLADAVDAYFAAPVAADGKVYLLSETGILSVLGVGQGLVPLHTAHFAEPCFATPALEDGYIWLRTHGTLYCLGRG